MGTQTIDCGIVALAGKINLNNLGDIRRQIERARKNYKNVVIDMSEVTLVDHQAVDFLAAQLNADIQLVNCPVYIQPWLLKAGI